MTSRSFEGSGVVFESFQNARKEAMRMPVTEGMEHYQDHDRRLVQSLYEEILPKYQPGGELSEPYEGGFGPEELAAMSAVNEYNALKAESDALNA